MRALILAVTLILSGCGQSEETVEFKDSEGDTRSLEVTDEGDTRTVKSDDGLMTAVGSQDETKANFPSYSPRYAGSEVVSVVDMDMAGMKRQMIVQHSADAADVVLSFYKAELEKAGKTFEEMDSGDGGVMLFEGPMTNPNLHLVIKGAENSTTITHAVLAN